MDKKTIASVALTPSNVKWPVIRSPTWRRSPSLSMKSRGVSPGDQGSWTAVDVLRDRLDRLDVPIVGGLPIGHGRHPIAVPTGTTATLDADEGTLTVTSAVR